MRLLFKKGKQKELLQKEKDLHKLTWNEFANILEIKKRKLIAFYNEETTIDKDIFNKLKLRNDYSKYIINEFEDNWGKSLGGNNSQGSTKEIIIPEKSFKLAEFYGILLGDGNIYKNNKNENGVYQLTITGNSETDNNYITIFIKNLIEELFGVKPRVRFLKKQNGVQIIVDSKRLVEFFEKEEFTSGNKIKNNLGIPKWIKEDKQYLAACIRGLYDTDGSFYKLTGQTSHQIHFKNYNLRLIKDVRHGLLSLGIKVSKIINNKSIVITQKEEIKKFYKSIGFHNSKHIQKIEAYFKAL